MTRARRTPLGGQVGNFFVSGESRGGLAAGVLCAQSAHAALAMFSPQNSRDGRLWMQGGEQGELEGIGLLLGWGAFLAPGDPQAEVSKLGIWQ